MEDEIPSFFLCPISLQVMKDPVTVSTGITYERSSIQKWISCLGKTTCPATMQPLQNSDLTPNHTLRKLIQDWFAAQSAQTTQPKTASASSMDPAQAEKLLSDLKNQKWCISLQIDAVKQLRSGISDNPETAKLVLGLHGIEILVDCMNSNSADMENGCYEAALASEEALNLISLLLPFAGDRPFPVKELMQPVSWILKRGATSARLHAAMVLSRLLQTSAGCLTESANQDLIEGLHQLLTDEVSPKATAAALDVLSALSRASRQHRMRTIEAGAVYSVIELLAETQRKSTCERLLGLLHILCTCAEGRALAADHGMCVAVVAKKVLRFSHVATEMAVRILWCMCGLSVSNRVLCEMAECGAVAKLCMVLQMECSAKAKAKAREILKLHGHFWRSSSCVPANLLHPSA